MSAANGSPQAAATSGSPPALEDAEIARLRLRIQGILAPRFSSPEETVGWLGAVQSQEYAYARWSIGKRAPTVDEAAVDRALADGSILRTHILRPTWHYVRPDDIRWMQAATAHRVRSVMASYDRTLDLDEPLFARSAEMIARALEGGRHRTRVELGEVLEAGGIAARTQRLAHIVMRAELDALICSGTPRGKQTTYALVAERAPAARVLEPDEALRELTLRYYVSHGPATERDFRWWSSLTAGEARRGLELAGNELERWSANGRTYWWRPQDPPAAEDVGGTHLLQAYDEMIVGYTESRGVMDVAGSSGRPPGAFSFYHALLVDGQFGGHWRRKVRGSTMSIELQAARRFNRAERREVEAAAARYGRFCGLAVEVSW